MTFGALRLMLRHIKSNKFMTAVSVLGLAAGMAVFIFVSLYIRHELSYDAFHKKADRIVLLTTDVRLGSAQKFHMPFTSSPMGPAIAREVNGIETFCRIGTRAQRPVRHGTTTFLERNVAWADSTLFEVFSYRLIEGNPRTALARRGSVVISQATAHRFFGESDPMGKQLIVNKDEVYTVTGVLSKRAGPSHIRTFDMVCSWVSSPISDQSPWIQNINYLTYFLLKKGVTPESIQPGIDASVERHAGELVRQVGGEFSTGLLPIRDVHLRAVFDFEASPSSGSITYVYQFGAIGLFILLIAGLNYINLTTARSTRRSKVVGISKALGATRAQLIRQFLTESVAVSLFAMVIALIGVIVLLPSYANLMRAEFVRADFMHPLVLGLLLIFAVVIGLLAGIYPAFVLSSFQPARVLKGEMRSGTSGSRLRAALVIVQFTISVILIIGTLVVMRQMDYVRSKPLGYDREHVLAITFSNWDEMTRSNTLRDEIDRLPGVLASCTCDHLPNRSSFNTLYHNPGTSADAQILISSMNVDPDFIPMLKMNLLAGRNFDPGMSTDSTDAIIINQAMAKMLGWEHPVGQVIDKYASINPVSFTPLHVIGVIQDFHFESLHSKVRPLLLRMYAGHPTYLLFRLQKNSVKKTLPEIEKLWRDFDPKMPFNYEFLDDIFTMQYRTELRLGKLFNYLTVLAIFIACLGLFALATFAAEQRTKEIGIRKALGATTGEMVALLTLDFLKLVALANLIAWPVAWYVMHNWLNRFAYRIHLSVAIFLFAAALSLIIALATVSLQALRAALTNPVKALRYE